MGQIITQIGGFAANSILLRYSREAETQSDLMGTQLLYDLSYDPRGMAEFFDKLAKEHKGSRTEEFFSNHPIPENRINNVNGEIRKLGGLPASARTDSPDFQNVKKIMLALPEPAKAPANPAGASTKAPVPQPPSTRIVAFESGGVRLQHPANWKPAVQGTNVTLAPDGGADAQGNLAYGLIIDVFQPQNARDINEATAEFLDSLRKNNPAMKTVRTRVQTRVDGQPALLSELSNESPAGGQETDIVVTVRRANGSLLYFVQVAPAKDFSQYQNAFRNVMNSVKLAR
jgi:predicted Zn-dependent protease